MGNELTAGTIWVWQLPEYRPIENRNPGSILVAAKFLFGPSGNIIQDPDSQNASATYFYLSQAAGETNPKKNGFFDTSAALIVPASFTFASAEVYANSLKSYVSTADFMSGTPLSGFSVAALSAKLVKDFRPGGPQDLQISYDGMTGAHVDAFRNAASWYYGFVCGYSGGNLQFFEQLAGTGNLLEDVFSKRRTNGAYGMPLVNQECIQAGYDYAQSLLSVSSNPNNFIPNTNPGTQPNPLLQQLSPSNKKRASLDSNMIYGNNFSNGSIVADLTPAALGIGNNASSATISAVYELYSGVDESGDLEEVDLEFASSSEILTYSSSNTQIATTLDYSAPNGAGTVTAASASYELEQPDGTIVAQSYSAIAAALGMAGVTGTVLAALNDAAAPPVLVAGTGNATYTTSSADSVLAEQASVIVPLASTGPQAIFNAGGTPVGAFIMPVVPAAEQSAVAYAAIVNADARTVTFIAVSAASDAANMVYVVDNGDNLIDEIPDYAQNLTSGSSLSKQNTQFTGSGYPGMPAYLVAVGNTTIIPSGDFNGSSTTPHAAGDVVGDEVLSGSPYLSLAALNSGAQAASNVFDAGIDSGDDTPDYGYTIGVAAGGGAVITGNGGSGYGGTATLTDVDQVELGGVAYALATVAAGGGATGLTTAPTEPGAGPASSGTIVAEGAGAGSTITLAYDAPVYWHVNAGGDRITLDGAPGDEFYMAGASSQYTPVYNQAAGALDLYAGSGESGTPTVFTIAGKAGGEVNFTDGGVLGLGDVGDATEYVGLGGQVNLEDDGNQTIWGGANADKNSRVPSRCMSA